MNKRKNPLSQVIIRRLDGTVNFYRPWKYYKVDFGKSDSEHWIGEYLSLLIHVVVLLHSTYQNV